MIISVVIPEFEGAGCHHGVMENDHGFPVESETEPNRKRIFGRLAPNFAIYSSRQLKVAYM